MTPRCGEAARLSATALDIDGKDIGQAEVREGPDGVTVIPLREKAIVKYRLESR